MKLTFFSRLFMSLLILAIASDCSAQSSGNEKSTTPKLPEGVYISANKLKVKSDYIATVSPDHKSVTVSKRNGNGITGIFTCDCGKGTGTCAITITGTNISCQGDCQCKMMITIPGVAGSFPVLFKSQQ